MRDRYDPPDLDELALALAAVFAAAGRPPDRSNSDLIWSWVDQDNSRGKALRVDYWWYQNDYDFPPDSWTLAVGHPHPFRLAGPDLADVLQKLRDPVIQKRYCIKRDK